MQFAKYTTYTVKTKNNDSKAYILLRIRALKNVLICSITYLKNNNTHY